jgi:pimeloyl-ACP methyl ester carboxylesterase
MEWTYQYHEVNEITLHAAHMGMHHKKVILFLHGFPEYGGAWIKQARFLSQNGYHVVAPDQRGYNLSSKPATVRDYLPAKLAGDIAALIKTLTSEPVTIVGHDWGGAVAWTLAQHYGPVVERLIILNMPHPLVMQKNLKSNPGQMVKSWYAGFFQLPALPEILCSAFDFKWLTLSLLKTARPHTFSAKEISDYQKTWSQPQALRSMINWYRAYKYNQLDIAPEVHIPSLILWGAKDTFLGRNMADESIKKCSRGELVILPQATHWLHHEEPDEVNAQILRFCSAS